MRRRTYSKSRAPRRVILVICEGETEERYVELLRQHYRLPITIKSKVLGNKVSGRLVSQILREEGLENEKDSRVVFIYDSDIPEVVEKLKRLNGALILSNPCLELWYLLHHQNHFKEATSKELLKMLSHCSPVWSGYVKGVLTDKQKEELLGKRGEAAERSKLLSLDKNPSTNMYRFLELLESEKKG